MLDALHQSAVIYLICPAEVSYVGDAPSWTGKALDWPADYGITAPVSVIVSENIPRGIEHQIVSSICYP